MRFLGSATLAHSRWNLPLFYLCLCIFYVRVDVNPWLSTATTTLLSLRPHLHLFRQPKDFFTQCTSHLRLREWFVIQTGAYHLTFIFVLFLRARLTTTTVRHGHIILIALNFYTFKSHQEHLKFQRYVSTLYPVNLATIKHFKWKPGLSYPLCRRSTRNNGYDRRSFFLLVACIFIPARRLSRKYLATNNRGF